MRTNPVKQTLAQGGTAVGTMAFEFCTPGLARLAANAGADFIIYDMEHTGWSIETVRDLIAEGKEDRMVAWQNRQVVDVAIEDAIAHYQDVDTDSALVKTARGLGICLGDQAPS